MFAILAGVLFIQWFEDSSIIVMMMTDFEKIVKKRLSIIKSKGQKLSRRH